MICAIAVHVVKNHARIAVKFFDKLRNFNKHHLKIPFSKNENGFIEGDI